MTDGQSHIVGTLSPCFSKSPVSLSLQVSLSLFLLSVYLSFIPSSPSSFSPLFQPVFSSPFQFLSPPLSSSSSIYLSPPRYHDLFLSASLWYFHLRLMLAFFLPPSTLFLSFFCVHSFMDPSFVFPPYSQIFHSLRASL